MPSIAFGTATNPTRDWSSLETFEEALRKLKYYKEIELSIIPRIEALSQNDRVGHQRLGNQLTACKSKILEWQVKVASANAKLKRELRN